MKNLHKTIGFIGAGTMGEAMISALIQAGVVAASAITASDVSPDRLDSLKRSYGIQVTEDNFSLFSACDIVILAVKPHHVGTILSGIASGKDYRIVNRKLVISIAAGIPISKIENCLYPPLDATSRSQLPIIRVMPNTPCLVLAGMSGMSPNGHATADDLASAEIILKAMGNVIEFKEADLDAVTAVSGSGPAYVFYYIESMIEAGVKSGLSSADASELVLTTIKGAVKLLEDRGDSPEHLRRLVTTPGGTTEAALKVLETRHFKQAIVDAIAAAAEKAREIGNR
ncbi:MAG: pyrroline-5-carboxylate reductase [Deltaproteobacteria bacterium]|nr:pyrroline-5-carboxylate reductase [Deltaproteobacteria bacterium]